jgi:hypothetical protein
LPEEREAGIYLLADGIVATGLFTEEGEGTGFGALGGRDRAGFVSVVLNYLGEIQCHSIR